MYIHFKVMMMSKNVKPFLCKAWYLHQIATNNILRLRTQQKKKIDFWDCTFFVRCSILIVIVSMVGKRFREFRQIMGTPSIYHQKKCIKKVPIFYLARSSKQLPFTDKYLLSSSSVHNPDNIWNWISKIFFHTYFLIKMRAHVPFFSQKASKNFCL